MKKSDVACLALRIIGIYLVASYLPYVSMFIHQSEPMSFKALLTFGVSLLSLIPGVVLIAFSKGLAVRIMPGADESLPGSSLSIADWQSIAFSAIGVSLIANAVPAITQAIAIHKFINATHKPYWTYFITPGIKLAIGAVLFLKARGLAGIWKGIQRGRPLREESS